MAAEPDGFSEFVTTRSGALLRTAYLLTGEQALAQDLLQEALARTWPRWSGIGVGARAVSYTHLDVYKRQVLMVVHPA